MVLILMGNGKEMAKFSNLLIQQMDRQLLIRKGLHLKTINKPLVRWRQPKQSGLQ
jgi:hypothetical protein